MGFACTGDCHGRMLQEYDESKLHTQLKYLESLFDLERSETRAKAAGNDNIPLFCSFFLFSFLSSVWSILSLHTIHICPRHSPSLFSTPIFIFYYSDNPSNKPLFFCLQLWPERKILTPVTYLRVWKICPVITKKSFACSKNTCPMRSKAVHTIGYVLRYGRQFLDKERKKTKPLPRQRWPTWRWGKVIVWGKAKVVPVPVPGKVRIKSGRWLIDI